MPKKRQPQAPKEPKIIRAKHDASNRWFLTLRETAQDSRLSFVARGIFWYLLSKSDDWVVMLEDLQREGNIGRDKAKNALIELADAGYLERPKKYQDSEGKWAWTPYILHEEPTETRTISSDIQPLTEKPSTDNQSLENRITDNQSLENRATENQSILKNTEEKIQKQNTEIQNPETTTRTLESEPSPQPENNGSGGGYEISIGGVFKAIEDNFKDDKDKPLKITPFIAEDITDLTNEVGAETMLEAIKIATTSEKRSLNYVKGILKRWREQGKPDLAQTAAPTADSHDAWVAKLKASPYAAFYNTAPAPESQEKPA